MPVRNTHTVGTQPAPVHASTIPQNVTTNITIAGTAINVKRSTINRLGTVGDYYQLNVGLESKGAKKPALQSVAVHEVDNAGNLKPAVKTLSAAGVAPHFSEMRGRAQTHYFAIPVGAQLDPGKRYALVAEVAVGDKTGKVRTTPLKINTDDV